MALQNAYLWLVYRRRKWTTLASFCEQRVQCCTYFSWLSHSILIKFIADKLLKYMVGLKIVWKVVDCDTEKCDRVVSHGWVSQLSLTFSWIQHYVQQSSLDLVQGELIFCWSTRLLASRKNCITWYSIYTTKYYAQNIHSTFSEAGRMNFSNNSL